MKALIPSVVLLFCLFGCDPPAKPPTRIKLNEEVVQNLDLVPTSFNESIKFRLQTDQHVFIGWGAPPPVKIGSRIGFYELSNGEYYIMFSGSNQFYYVGSK